MMIYFIGLIIACVVLFLIEYNDYKANIAAGMIYVLTLEELLVMCCFALMSWAFLLLAGIIYVISRTNIDLNKKILELKE